MTVKKCRRCSKEVKKPYNYSRKQWEGFRYCSNKCSAQANADNPKNHPRAQKNSGWKGDDVKYSGIHMWVRRNYGQPSICENCGKQREDGAKAFDWANISGKYLRRRSDWRYLCRKCHKKYDNGKRKKEGKS